MVYSTDKDNPGLFYGHAIGHTRFALSSNERRTTLHEQPTKWTAYWGILQTLLLSVGLGQRLSRIAEQSRQVFEA